MKYGRTQDKNKHAAILKAAMRLFLKEGYSKTSMDAIAASSGVTKQTVYAHYHSKDSLFSHIITELCEKHAPPDAVLEDMDQSVEKLLYKIGLNFIHLIGSQEGLAVTRLVISEAARHPKLAQRYYEGGTQRMISMMSAFLEQQNKRGALFIKDTQAAASNFFAMLRGTYHLRMIFAIKPAPTSKQIETHVSDTVALFMKMYGS